MTPEEIEKVDKMLGNGILKIRTYSLTLLADAFAELGIPEGVEGPGCDYLTVLDVLDLMLLHSSGARRKTLIDVYGVVLGLVAERANRIQAEFLGPEPGDTIQ